MQELKNRREKESCHSQKEEIKENDQEKRRDSQICDRKCRRNKGSKIGRRKKKKEENKGMK